VRFLRTSEPEKGAKLAEALIKLVTGGEPIQARHLNRDFFRFHPRFKLTIGGNYRRDRRRRRGHLASHATGAVQHHSFRRKSATRSWSRSSAQRGLRHPEPAARWIARLSRSTGMLWPQAVACVRPKPGARIQASVLHKVFVAWGKVNGVKEWSQAGLGRAMRERGFVSKQSNFIMWLDVELIKHEGDFVDFSGNPRTQGDGEDG
jgi:putative DNA primase/helicase